jgi:CRISPR-associated exonuclease Cas4
MTFPESDLVPLSALQHFLFCPRPCALIHVEQIWVESGLTADGGGWRRWGLAGQMLLSFA